MAKYRSIGQIMASLWSVITPGLVFCICLYGNQERISIRTNVVSCLSSGLAKNNKVMSMFVLFSWLFSISKIWLTFRK